MKVCYTWRPQPRQSDREAMPWANRFELAMPSQFVAMRELLEARRRCKSRCEPRRPNNPDQQQTP
jgi:hypothetical protein